MIFLEWHETISHSSAPCGSMGCLKVALDRSIFAFYDVVRAFTLTPYPSRTNLSLTNMVKSPTPRVFQVIWSLKKRHKTHCKRSWNLVFSAIFSILCPFDTIFCASPLLGHFSGTLPHCINKSWKRGISFNDFLL